MSSILPFVTLDENDKILVYQYITPIFILAILLANFLFICQIVRKAVSAGLSCFKRTTTFPWRTGFAGTSGYDGRSGTAELTSFTTRFGFMNRPKCCLLIVLAIADILVAVFSLTVFEVTLFKELHGAISMSTLEVATSYMSYFVPFIYGIGLCVLCVELIVRCILNRYGRISSTSEAVMLAACFTVPLILALCIVLPVLLKKPVALFGISVILPSTLAVIVSLVTRCLPLVASPSVEDVTLTLDSEISQTSSASHQPRNLAASNQDASEEDEVQLLSDNTSPTQGLFNPSFSVTSSVEEIGQHPGYPNPASPDQSSPVNSEQRQENPVEPSSAYQDQLAYFIYIRREQYTLAMISALSFVCLMPYAIYLQTVEAHLESDWTDPLAGTAIPDFFFWFFILRSFITPLFWTRKLNEPVVDSKAIVL